MTETAIWTEADQAYSDFVSEIACSEDDAAAILGALEERGLFSVSEAVALMLTPKEDAEQKDGPSSAAGE